jgi:hypothetical protein
MVQWGGGVAAYSLLSGRLSWACQLPTTLLAVDSSSARCAVGTPSGSLVFLDAGGPLGEGAGLLHGCRMQAAEFLTLQDAQVGAHTYLWLVSCLSWASGLLTWCRMCCWLGCCMHALRELLID